MGRGILSGGGNSAKAVFVALLRRGLLQKERICSLGSKFSPFEVNPFSEEILSSYIRSLFRRGQVRRKANRKFQKLSPFIKKLAENLPSVLSPFKCAVIKFSLCSSEDIEYKLGEI